MKPKTIAIILLSLILLNVFSRSLVGGINLWIAENSVKESKILQKVGDDLIVKIPISLPYHQNWVSTIEEGLLTVFEGDFYESNFQKYENDTLYTTYKKIEMNRNHIYSLFENINGRLKMLEKEKHNPLQKSVQLLEDFHKNYFKILYTCLSFYMIENLHDFKFADYANRLLSGWKILNTPPPNNLYI